VAQPRAKRLGWVSEANKKLHPEYGFTNAVAFFESFLKTLEKTQPFLEQLRLGRGFLSCFARPSPTASRWAGPTSERSLKIFSPLYCKNGTEIVVLQVYRVAWFLITQ